MAIVRKKFTFFFFLRLGFIPVNPYYAQFFSPFTISLTSGLSRLPPPPPPPFDKAIWSLVNHSTDESLQSLQNDVEKEECSDEFMECEQYDPTDPSSNQQKQSGEPVYHMTPVFSSHPTVGWSDTPEHLCLKQNGKIEMTMVKYCSV